MKQRKDGRWQKSITINGKRLFFYSSELTERKAQKDIEQQMLIFADKKQKGEYFGVVADEWYSSTEPRLSESTYARYGSLIKRCKEYFKDYRIKDITIQGIERFLARLQSQSFSSKSIKAHYSVLRLAFKYAFVNGYTEIDVSTYVTVPKGSEAVTREALTAEQQEVVKNSLDKPFGLFAYTIMYTGMRRGEAIALRWENIDFENKIITVSENAIFPTNQPIVKTPKTENGKRKIILLDCLADVLYPLRGSGFVFTGESIKGNSWYTRQWKAYQRATQLDVTPHQLRHTYATILFEADIDVKDTQTLMGHADISTTRNIYTHIRKNRLEQTAAKLNQFIGK